MVDSTEWVRIWLPKQMCNCLTVKSSVVLIGWINVGFKSLDLVVAAALPDFQSEYARARLQEDLDALETKLPLTLRNRVKLRILGECLIEQNHNFEERGKKESDKSDKSDDGPRKEMNCIGKSSNFRSEGNREELHSRTNPSAILTCWAVFSASKLVINGNELDCMPCLRYLYFNGERAQVREHIVVYQQPLVGSHHFSCVPWRPTFEMTRQKSSAQVFKPTVKRPEWLTALELQQSSDLEIIMMELNYTAFIHEVFNDPWAHTGLRQKTHSAVISICFHHLWCFWAGIVAIWATMLRALAQVLHLVLVVRLSTVPYVGYLLQRSMTWQALNIRCQQLMAWPFILLWGGLGPDQPNVATAHRLKLSSNFTWSVLVVDYLLGATAGYLVLKHHNAILQLAVHAGKSLTNDVLRIGCVWLMGIPAGLKLNNELAGAIGTLSLHVIQSWSTLLYVPLPVLTVLLQTLGSISFLLGFTVFAAIISDMALVTTLHVLCLHHGIAFLHKIQLQALAALWRLFRGRKRNPLRRKVDTFDCSVEQLVVGSLMFTPLLLLLPTTSVFYTYFSIIFWTQFSAQVVLYYLIAVVHSIPVALWVTWMIRPRQFPSGVYIQQLRSTHVDGQDRKRFLSILGIRPATLGELLQPFLIDFWVAPRWSSSATFFRKVVSGKRYDLRLRLGHSVSLPSSPISLVRFAWLCYSAVAGERK